MHAFGDAKKVLSSCSEFFPSSYRFSFTLNKQEIIITESANLVTKLNGLSGESVQNWSFDELNKLHTPLVVFYNDQQQERFLGVHTGNRLVEWRVKHNGQIIPVREKTYASKIVSVLCLGQWKKFNPLIVFERGQIESYDKTLLDSFTEPQDDLFDKNEEIVHVECSRTSKTTLAVYLITINARKNVHNVYKCSVDKSESFELITNFLKLSFNFRFVQNCDEH